MEAHVSGGIWSLAVIIGPILLIIVLLWAILRNRASATRSNIEHTERATRELYEREDENAKRDDVSR